MPLLIPFLILCVIFPPFLFVPLAIANWLGPLGIFAAIAIFMAITIYRDFYC